MAVNNPKRILIIGYKVLNWLYILIIPILRRNFAKKQNSKKGQGAIFIQS